MNLPEFDPDWGLAGLTFYSFLSATLLPGGSEIALFLLLRFLLVNQGKVVSKAQILDHVWDYDFGGDGGVVETYIGYLRRKIDGQDPRLIQTVRGVGYTLRSPG